jgi:predicted CoA-binding protein
MRNNRSSIEAFLDQPAFALVGASRSGHGFGNVILRELRAKGMHVYPVHPVAATLDGVTCYHNLNALPEPVGGLIVCVPPDDAVGVLRDGAAAGIRHVWIQQGADSPYVATVCRELGLDAVIGECILMFARPTGLHWAHRALAGMLGRVPA